MVFRVSCDNMLQVTGYEFIGLLGLLELFELFELLGTVWFNECYTGVVRISQ